MRLEGWSAAATGYAVLGLYAEAMAELDELPPEDWADLRVVEARIQSRIEFAGGWPRPYRPWPLSRCGQPPFPRPPVRPNGCFRGLPPKANPLHFLGLVSLLHREAKVLSTGYEGDDILVRAVVPRSLAGRLEGFGAG